MSHRNNKIKSITVINEFMKFQNKNIKRITLRVPEEVDENLKKYAIRKCMSVNELILKAIVKSFKRKNKKSHDSEELII